MARPAIAHLNLSALQHNLHQTKCFAPKSKIIAVLKANGYGHGMLKMAQALGDADAFAVASIEEGLLLRDGGINKKIILLEGFFDIAELPYIAKENFEMVIHHENQIKLLQSIKNITTPLSIWLKIDTGMNRLGFSPEAIPNILNQLENSPIIKKPIKLMTHFARADEWDNSCTTNQIKLFKKFINPNTEFSAANSAGIIAWPESHYDWVRPGIMLYGVSPMKNKTGMDHNLLPVMTVKSKLISIKKIKQNQGIGYNHRWICPKDMTVGVVAMGYGDGYPRTAKDGTPVLINGIKCPIVGNVSMDMLTVDLSNLPNPEIGDEVVLWGEGLPVEIIAKHAGTIPYEILCHGAMRVPFDYS